MGISNSSRIKIVRSHSGENIPVVSQPTIKTKSNITNPRNQLITRTLLQQYANKHFQKRDRLASLNITKTMPGLSKQLEMLFSGAENVLSTAMSVKLESKDAKKATLNFTVAKRGGKYAVIFELVFPDKTKESTEIMVNPLDDTVIFDNCNGFVALAFMDILHHMGLHYL